MTSPTDIWNEALLQIGARAQVTSINPSDGSPAANVGSRLYQTQVDAVARAAHWNCLRLQAVLTLLKAAQGTPENPNGTTLPMPPTGWLYEYAMPSDCLAVRFLIPTPSPNPAVSPPLTTGVVMVTALQPIMTAMPFVPAIDYNTQNPPAQIRVILTNAPRAQAVYTARVDNPDLWDSSLKNANIAVLAAWGVNPLNMKSSLLQERVAIAQQLVGAARISDGNEGVTPNDHIPDWIQARWRRGTLMGSQGEGPYLAPWSPLSLPGGLSY